MTNPFALFDLPVQFTLDTELLSQRYLSLQKSLHPDNFSAHSAQEQRLSVQKSAEINDALQVLKDPLLRAEAIIQFHTNEQQDIELKSTRDMEFLMQQLEWRETLESIENAKNEAKLTAFISEIEQQQKQILQQLETALENKQWADALAINDKFRFIKKLFVEIERVEEIVFAF